MNVFEFVLILLVIVFVYRVVDTYIKSRSDREKTSEDTDMDTRLQAMEDRVRVLERIVTDDRYDLKRKFEALED
jgi:hypothetical protein